MISTRGDFSALNWLSHLFAALEQWSSKISWIITLLVIIAGIGYSLSLGNAVRYLPDEQDYVDLSMHIARDFSYTVDGDRLTAYRAPGYPLLLAILRIFGADIIHFRILNFFLLAACIVTVNKILKTRSSPLAGVFGSLLIALYPVLFYTAGTLYPQTLASFLFLLFIYLITASPAQERNFWFAGLILGYLVLTVPSFTTAILVVLFWLFVTRPAGWLKRSLILLFISLLVVSVWTVRNYMAFDTFVFVSSNFGENLLVGNSENTRPNSGRNVDITRYENESAQMDEVERDQYYRRRAIEYISSHKTETILLYFQKVLNYFNFRNELVTQQEESKLKDLIMLISFGTLMSLFVVRLSLFRVIKPTSIEWLLFLLFTTNAFFAAVFFTRIRFRVPFDFLLIMLVATFIPRLMSSFPRGVILSSAASPG